MSLDSRCENCGHRKLAHLDNQKPTGTGACHHGALGAECQCPVYVCDSEGSDIVDVNEKVYDASVDTIVTPKKAHEELMAELQMHKATAIIEDHNTETRTPEELDLNQISINSMRPAPEGQINNGDMWRPTPDVILLWLDGQWLTPDAFNAARIAKQENASSDNDPVNHPSHYTAYPEIEVIQLTRWMSFNLGNAVKYIARAGLKDSDKEIQDLEKAIWYIKDEIARKRGEYGSMQE